MPDYRGNPTLDEVEPEAWPGNDCPHDVPEDIVSVEEPITGTLVTVCTRCGFAVDPMEWKENHNLLEDPYGSDCPGELRDI